MKDREKKAVYTVTNTIAGSVLIRYLNFYKKAGTAGRRIYRRLRMRRSRSGKGSVSLLGVRFYLKNNGNHYKMLTI